MSFGIYVHWPYCSRICPYCDFNVYRARDQDELPLLDAIIADIEGHAARIGPREAVSLFLGGGTPSLLSPRGVERLIGAARAAFPFAPEVEITLEANPDERARYADLVGAGVNRLSVGVQALRDDALAALGRTHSAADAREAVEVAARTGARVSLDLIYAREAQSASAWRAELEEALALPAEHLSLYQLTIEPTTAFGLAVARGTLKPPDGDLSADLYEATQDACERAGAPAYEISNHARGAHARARHNLIYWQGGEWLGVGPGAHGRVQVGGTRVATAAFDAPADYIAGVKTNGVGWETSEGLDAEARGEEALAMGLRLLDEGVARADVAAITDPARIAALQAEGLLRVTGDRIALTPRARLLADRVTAELLRL